MTKKIKKCCENCVNAVVENFFFLYCDVNSNKWDERLTEIYSRGSKAADADIKLLNELMSKENNCPMFRSEPLTTDEKIDRHFTDY